MSYSPRRWFSIRKAKIVLSSISRSAFSRLIARSLKYVSRTQVDSWLTGLPAGFMLCVGNKLLAKCPSDLKQNGTQEKIPFSGIVFHTLSYGVLFVVASKLQKPLIGSSLIGCERISTSQKCFLANTSNKTDRAV